MKLIVKLFSEITIKTKPVRKRFTQQLQNNIKRVLARRDIHADVVNRWDLLEVSFPDQKHEEAVVNELGCIPGVAHFLVVDEFAFVDLHDIYKRVQEVVGGSLRGKTFAVRCKRNGNHDFTSHDAERYIGGGLLEHTEAKGVDLGSPDTVVSIEIRGERLYVVRERHEGQGGYPLGATAPVLSLLSGGFDSAVASYLTSRRGMDTHFCFFNLGGHAHEVGVKQVAYFLWDRYASSSRVAFLSVPFEKVVEEILSKIDNAYMGVVLKRMMLRVASRLAEKMSIDALVTGESVSQVASQTVRNLSVIDEVIDTLVLRPLVTMDKEEIIRCAERIGTAVYSEHMPEYCGVISVKPTTLAKRDRVNEQEARFNFGLLDEVIAETQLTPIDQIYGLDSGIDSIEFQSVPSLGQVIIDLRYPDQVEQRPLALHANQVITIPFYQINRLFSDLDADKEYLLYCERGAMSQLHAAHLHAEGFLNVKVYRP